MSDSSLLDRIAERYVRLVLSLGVHDTDYVDAYYGPAAWQLQATQEHPTLEEIGSRADATRAELGSLQAATLDDMHRLRLAYLTRQMESLAARVRMLQGARLSFDEEALALYDAVPPSFTAEYFAGLVADVGRLLPGAGDVHERFEEFKRRFVIPPDRLASVFDAAIAEGRRRCLERAPLPENERFSVEYVTQKPWSGYNWYKGNAASVIQVNVDFPITIDRAIDLACHEGYPGHHVYNSMLEQALVQRRGWVEFTAYALFSPQSLVAEGTANFGIEMAFPNAERVEFEREVLFPLAGIDPAHAQHYYDVHTLVQRLAYAGNEAARRYLDGSISREQAAQWLVRYGLMSPDRAGQRTRFFDRYRSYVINYNLGQDLVRQAIERRGGTPDHPDRRWQLFVELLTSPRIPSTL